MELTVSLRYVTQGKSNQEDKVAYKVKRRGDDLEIQEHPEGNCKTLGDVEKLIHSQAEQHIIDHVYMMSSNGKKTEIEWRDGLKDDSTVEHQTQKEQEKQPNKNRRLTTCSDCGGSVSIHAKTCPHCGAKRRAQASGCGTVVVIFIGLIVLVSIIDAGKPETLKAGFDEMDALSMCQNAIKSVAVDPDTVKIPYVKNFGSGREAYYAWGRSTKHIRMRNGFGLEVPVSASCTVNLDTKKIVILTMNGETII